MVIGATRHVIERTLAFWIWKRMPKKRFLVLRKWEVERCETGQLIRVFVFARRAPYGHAGGKEGL
jgi:hypothetical protein